ncbi:hypothetical protein BJF78_02000 [Pseudonocardia sp. CNS-139]|nr:hypothetical protein BJF78_02000 [Pseudonocardia sp. CNS-139]
MRQALNYAADREGLAAILSGTGKPANQYVPQFEPPTPTASATPTTRRRPSSCSPRPASRPGR